ncbi:hypothetical protein M2138_001664 [Dysgonomonadaceae bacterium PH5-43]|nr:hypothetical protein [Dysgonomonadaceae bacterium PH5-43]
MKNLFFLISVLLLSCISVKAQLRTENEARDIAKSFFSESITTLKADNDGKLETVKLVYAPTMKNSSTPTVIEKPYYYVYNIGDNSGFIIVSGDERAKQVLAYSDNNKFDINEIPDNLKYWLSVYETELDYLCENAVGEEVSLEAPVDLRVDERSYADYVKPLVKAKWDQGAPYNNSCPVIDGSTAVVGCTAVAGAQIMSYYQWPKKGNGSLTYEVAGSNRTINFANATYDWSQLANVYSPSIDKANEQALEIAKLMYHVSFSAQTTYGSTSGAYGSNMMKALVSYFDYDKNILSYVRNSLTKSEWENIIKKELSAARPVLYSGYSDDYKSGHAFVCDGYDENGLFHFNWGWAGYADGYYELSALSPGTSGIGAGAGSYNRGQQIYTGIQPNKGSATPVSQLGLETLKLNTAKETTRMSSISVVANTLTNNGIASFYGHVALGFVSSNNTVVTMASQSVEGLPSGFGWTSLEFSDKLTNLTDGKYKMYVVCKAKDQSDWTIVTGKSGAIGYYNVEVSSLNIKFTEPTDIPKLEFVSSSEVQEIYKLETDYLKFTLKNTGGGEYNSFISIAYDTSGAETFVKDVPIVLAAGETKEFLISGSCKKTAFNYDLYLLYDETNNFKEASKVLNAENPIKAKFVLTSNKIVSLQLAAPISFSSGNDDVTPNTFKLKVPIKNLGDKYTGKIYVAVGSGTNYSSFDVQTITLEKSESTVLYFTNPPAKEYGILKIGVYYEDRFKSKAYWFTPEDNCFVSIKYNADPMLDIETVEVEDKNISIYPNPVEDILYVSLDDYINSISVFDVSGKKLIDKNVNTSGVVSVPVNSLTTGVYVIIVEMPSGVYNGKFYKK